MPDTMWYAFEETAWTGYRRQLLEEKGSSRQIDFLEAVGAGGTAFLDQFKDLTLTGSQNLPIYQTKLSDSQYRTPDPRTEERLYNLWSTLSPLEASRSSLWAHLTLIHVGAGHIKASFLAGNGKAHQSGKDRLDRALALQGKKRDQTLDDCVRSVIRHLGGVAERGNRSLFVDCPFARAWWRTRLRQRVGQQQGVDSARVAALICGQQKERWQQFISAMVSRTPVFGLDVVQDAVLSEFAQLVHPKSHKPPTAKVISQVLRTVALDAATLEYGVLTPSEVRDRVRDIVAAA